MNASAFNLIPESYRRRQETLAILRRTAVSLVVVLVGGALVAGYLKHQSVRFNQELSALEQDQATALETQREIELLNDRLSLLQRNEKLLLGLRAGVEVPYVMRAIENSLPPGKAWLNRWQFVRSGIVTEKQPEPRPPGYFIRLESPEPVSSWQAVNAHEHQRRGV